MTIHNSFVGGVRFCLSCCLCDDNLALSFAQGSNRIVSFWFAKIWFAKVNQKSRKGFDSRDESKSFFISPSRGRIILFVIFIYFDLRFKLILFILIRFDFYSSRIWIHLRIKIKTNQKSKVGETWFTHLRIIIWFDFESKANQAGPSPGFALFWLFSKLRPEIGKALYDHSEFLSQNGCL